MHHKCVFIEPGLDHAGVIRVLFSITEFLRKYSDNEGTAEVLMQCCKLAAPTVDGTPFLLKTVAEVNARMVGLTCEMRESKLFKLAEKLVVRKVVMSGPFAKEGVKRKAAPKATRGKSAANSKVAALVCPTASDEGRPTTFIDDLVNTVEYALRTVKQGQVQLKAMRQAVMYGVRFAMEGSVDVPLLEAESKKMQKRANATPQKKEQESKEEESAHHDSPMPRAVRLRLRLWPLGQDCGSGSPSGS